MRLTSRLVRLVESRSETLAAGLTGKAQHCTSRHEFPSEEVKHLTNNIYSHAWPRPGRSRVRSAGNHVLDE